MKYAVAALLFAAACQGCATSTVVAQPLAATHRSTVPLPQTSIDQFGASFTITGLSGIAYAGPSPEPGLHRFLAVMDNSDKLVTIDAAVSATGSITSALVVGGVRLSLAADFEDIAIGSGGLTALLCEEGTPGVREFELASGNAASALVVPSVFSARRDNFGFEALTRAGSKVWTANEEALTVDGPPAMQSAGTVVRLLRFDSVAGSYAAAAQYAYVCEPLHGASITGARSGLVAMAVLPSGQILALERSFAFNLGGFFRSRLFAVDLEVATDVSAVASLDDASFIPVGKDLLWSGDQNNLEGLCVGPALEGGGRMLVGIVDDGDPISSNALVSIQVAGPVEADCRADIDGSGLVDVPDIFGFLGWWFASDPRAEFDGQGGIAVPDIFAFLAAWFVGCV